MARSGLSVLRPGEAREAEEGRPHGAEQGATAQDDPQADPQDEVTPWDSISNFLPPSPSQHQRANASKLPFAARAL